LGAGLLLQHRGMQRFAVALAFAGGLMAQTADAPPSVEEQTRVIESARESALQYTKGLPDFLCTQTVSRYAGEKLKDTLEVSVGYTAKGEQYKLEKIDGKATTRTFAKVGGVTGRGEFGTLLGDIFGPESAAVFQWQRWADLNGRRTHVFTFAIAQDHSRYRIHWATAAKDYRMIAGYHGTVLVDPETCQVLRITTEVDGIPAKWPVRRTFGSLDYGFFEIAGTRYLLPRRVESNIVLKSVTERNVSEFEHYRRFTGDASISF
jgi:hypothetical protein